MLLVSDEEMGTYRCIRIFAGGLVSIWSTVKVGRVSGPSDVFFFSTLLLMTEDTLL